MSENTDRTTGPAMVHVATPEGITPCGAGTRDVAVTALVAEATCLECLSNLAQATPADRQLATQLDEIAANLDNQFAQILEQLSPTMADSRAAQASLDPAAFENALCVAGDHINHRRQLYSQEPLSGREIGQLLGAVALAIRTYQNTTADQK